MGSGRSRAEDTFISLRAVVSASTLACRLFSTICVRRVFSAGALRRGTWTWRCLRGRRSPQTSRHEPERFDRVGARGRRGVISLGAWSNEHLGRHLNWTSAATELLARGELTDSDARAVRWLDVFGELIANSDRHFWNVSFFWEPGGRATLAPAYDMLPMLFAPGISGIIERTFQPTPPTAATLDVWPDAARSAAKFWKLAGEGAAVSSSFRKIAAKCLKTLDARRAELLHLERKG